jgi:hypothetical protein
MNMFFFHRGEVERAACDVSGNVVIEDWRQRVSKERKLSLLEIYMESAIK